MHTWHTPPTWIHQTFKWDACAKSWGILYNASMTCIHNTFVSVINVLWSVTRSVVMNYQLDVWGDLCAVASTSALGSSLIDSWQVEGICTNNFWKWWRTGPGRWGNFQIHWWNSLQDRPSNIQPGNLLQWLERMPRNQVSRHYGPWQHPYARLWAIHG